MNQDQGQIPQPSYPLPLWSFSSLGQKQVQLRAPAEVIMTMTILVIIKMAFIFEPVLSWDKILVWILSLGPHHLPECMVYSSSTDDQTEAQIVIQLLSHVRLFVTPWTASHQASPCPSPSPRICLNSCPLSLWHYPTISSSAVPSPPAFNLSHYHGLFQWVNSSHQVARVLELHHQHRSFQWIFSVDFL